LFVAPFGHLYGGGEWRGQDSRCHERTRKRRRKTRIPRQISLGDMRIGKYRRTPQGVMIHDTWFQKRRKEEGVRGEQ
jgi:hypothetical protein